MKLTFSIVIPVYNVAPYLRECLDSVLAQTVNDPASPSYAAASWEAICVDDGSTDGGGAILDEYAAKDPRFMVIHQANAGVSAARNAALDVAQGEWVMFLDADDVYAQWCLEGVVSAFGQIPEADIVRFRSIEFELDLDWSGCRYENFMTVRHDPSAPMDGFLCYVPMWSRVFKKELLHGLTFPAYRIGEDQVFTVAAMCRSKCCAELPVVCYAYRQRQGSAMRSGFTCADLNNIIDWRCEVLNLLASSRRMVESSVVDSYSRGVCDVWISHLFKVDPLSCREAIVHWRRRLWRLRSMRFIPQRHRTRYLKYYIIALLANRSVIIRFLALNGFVKSCIRRVENGITLRGCK